MAEVDLPPGFVLDESELPDGFELDAPAPKKSSGLAANYFGLMSEPLMHLGSGAIATPVSGLAGIGAAALKSVGVDTDPSRVIERVWSAMTYQPRSDTGKAMTEYATYPFRKLAEGADAAGDVANAPQERPGISASAARLGLDPMQDTRASPGERAATGALVNTAIQSLPALLLSRGSRSASVGPRVAPSAEGSAGRGLAGVREATPTTEQLSAAATDAYKRAKDAGVVISEESFGGLKQKVAGELAEEGLDPTLHPATTAALKRLSETEGQVSLQNLETLRKIANDAGGAIAAADRRLAGKIVDDIDDFVEGMSEKDLVSGDPKAAGALNEARDFYKRKKKAEEIQQLIHRAELSAPNFSASGMENALRTEFRALAKNEKRMRRFSAEERAAIERVAKGGPVENTLRMLGKFAPTGTVSGVLSGGAGFMAGGPLGAVALPTAGLLSRYAATQMTLRNAQAAQELMRRGAPVQAPFNPKPPPSLLYPEQETTGIF